MHSTRVIAQPDHLFGGPPQGDPAEVLAAVLAGSHEAVSCWERRPGRTVHLIAGNQRFMALVGRAAEPVPVGASISDIVPRMPPETVALMHHVLETGQPFALKGYAVRMPDGGVRRWDATLTPVAGCGRPVLVASILDVTNRSSVGAAAVRQNGSSDEIESDGVTACLASAAELVGVLSAGGSVDDLVTAVSNGLRVLFGLEARLLAPREGQPGTELDEHLQHRFEVCPHVFFVPHDVISNADQAAGGASGAVVWQGPGHWHPKDTCLVRLDTREGRPIAVLSVGSEPNRPLPTPWQFRMLGAYASFGGAIAEASLCSVESAASRSDTEVTALRRELMEELLLHRYLVEIGSRLGASQAAAAPGTIFPLLAERLHEVLPIKSLTVNRVDQPTQTFRPIYHSDPGPAEAMLRFEAPVGAGATGRAAESRRGVIANAGHDQPAIEVPGTPIEDEHLLAVPVLSDDQVRAVLTLRRSWRAHPFTPADARRAELFAQHVASALLLVELAEAGAELGASRKTLAEQVGQLESLNRIKDEFVANVSHELRTPLTAVLGNLATVTHGPRLTDDVRDELLDAADRQARRLGELLENLLAASRLVGADPAVATVTIDVRSFLQEIAATLRGRAPGRTLSVRVHGSPTVHSDPTLLYRVLFNLGDNALKYSDESVALSAKVKGGTVRIDVRDRGVGISPDDLARVFDRFHQVDAANARRVGGVGLGLFLSSRLATALGGRIDVVSEPGKGSTFTLVLPVQPQMSLPDETPGQEHLRGVAG